MPCHAIWRAAVTHTCTHPPLTPVKRAQGRITACRIDETIGQKWPTPLRGGEAARHIVVTAHGYKNPGRPLTGGAGRPVSGLMMPKGARLRHLAQVARGRRGGMWRYDGQKESKMTYRHGGERSRVGPGARAEGPGLGVGLPGKSVILTFRTSSQTQDDICPSYRSARANACRPGRRGRGAPPLRPGRHAAAKRSMTCLFCILPLFGAGDMHHRHRLAPFPASRHRDMIPDTRYQIVTSLRHRTAEALSAIGANQIPDSYIPAASHR